MSGKRLLDAAAIFNASRRVAAKHVVLRKDQLDNYNKTSSLAHAIKNETDRVTLTGQGGLSTCTALQRCEPKALQ